MNIIHDMGARRNLISRRNREWVLPCLPDIPDLKDGGYEESAILLGQIALVMMIEKEPPNRGRVMKAYNEYQQSCGAEDEVGQKVFDILIRHGFIELGQNQCIYLSQSGQILGAHFLQQILDNSQGEPPAEFLH